MPRDYCRSPVHFVIYLACYTSGGEYFAAVTEYAQERNILIAHFLTDDITIAAQNLIAPRQRGQANKPWLPSMG